MKLKHTLSLLSLATCAALSTSALVTFNGTIEASACGTVEVVGGDIVTLPTQSAAIFTAAGTRQGATPFSVKVDSCAPPTGTFAVAFNHQDVDEADGYLPNIGVTGLVYELTNLADQQIKFYKNAPAPNTAPDPNTPTGLGAGPHTLDYKIWYRSIADTVGTGSTSKTATMTVTYQ